MSATNFPGLWRQVREDLVQVETGERKEVVVWLHPKAWSDGLPGLYSEGQAQPVTRYGGISEETDGEWVWFYVPKTMGFSLDMDALYHENKTVAWNMENARQYHIDYTENFHLAVCITPVEEYP